MKAENALCCCAVFGPRFHGGWTLNERGGSFEHEPPMPLIFDGQSYCEIDGRQFEDVLGKGYESLTGQDTFAPTEVEVFAVTHIG